MSKLNLSVLLVEDDRLSLMVYSEFIKGIVKDVYTATNGLEGISVFKKHHPDIIITDIMMPEMDGLEMTRKIKEIAPEVKAIMISGHSEADYFIRSIDLGVEGYLLKPVDNQRLENKIRELGDNILLSKKVAETEKKFQDFAALLPQVVFEANLEGRLTFVNELALKKFNYNKKDLRNGLFLHELISSPHGKGSKDIMKLINSGMNYQEQEVTCKTKKGELFPALIYTSEIIENEKVSGIRGVMVDITTRKKMMEELKELNLELEEKVKERTALLSNEIKEKEKAEKELIKAKEKAEESDHLKGIFLANVSHEIQTPIKAIISFSNLLQSPGQDENRRQELISIIESNSNALLNLTNDILEFTRLQANTIKLFRINFDLNLFLKEMYPVFETLKRKQAEKDIKLKLSIPKGSRPVLIKSDPSRLRQVFTNLISNAFKFTHEGKVEYGYNIKDDQIIEFFVKDTGLGISEKYQKRIFERFIQEPSPMGIKKEGTGLGLPITQSLIKKLGGTIWVNSQLGKGSTFFFRFPDIMIQEESEQEERYMWKDKQILIIEDEIQDYIALEEILKNRIRIHYLNNAEQALEFCDKNKQIDICLFRWTKSSSKVLMEDIQKMNHSHVIVAMADNDVKGKEAELLKKYFTATIKKPFTRIKVLKAIDKHMK